MQYPSITEYVSAIRNSTENLDKLAHLVPVLDNHDEPYRSVGGFAVVFKMQDKDTGKYYAIKCFHEEQNDRAESYIEISKALRSNKSSYIMDVSYFSKELFVDTRLSNETEFPVLQMDWIDGETMETYIASHYRDTDAIKQLYLKFCDLALWLRSKPFAHGDIKPDNIMIKPNGNLTLVDYDGMFVPALKGKKSPTIGTKSFSHPHRTDADFNEHIDDFSLASIAISLLAMSEDASLYKEFSAPDRLLFSEKDYLDFENSDINKRLQSMGGLFPKLLELFTECLSTYNGNEGVYDQIFDLQTKAPEIIRFENLHDQVVYIDDEVHLLWEIKNATLIMINGKDVSERTYFKEKIKKTTEYELKATNGLKESIYKITIKVLPKPKIVFRSDKVKLRKGKDHSTRLYWSVTNAKSVSLLLFENEEKVKLNGEKHVEISSHTDVKLNVVGLDGKRLFTKKITLNVFTESDVQFTADKLYSLPEVPIKLAWFIKHAKEAILKDFGKVNLSGEIIVTPQKTTTYILIVKDAFGEHNHPLTIHMLPLPQVKTLLVPTPQIVNNISITVRQPKFNIDARFPKVDIDWIKAEVPQVPSFTDLGLNIELSPPLPKKQFSFVSSIIKAFKHFKG